MEISGRRQRRFRRFVRGEERWMSCAWWENGGVEFG
jgi:hypothetical protein